jgi:dipeptide/tripeptide permease
MNKSTSAYEQYRQMKALKRKKRKVLAYKIIFLVTMIFWIILLYTI